MGHMATVQLSYKALVDQVYVHSTNIWKTNTTFHQLGAFKKIEDFKHLKGNKHLRLKFYFQANPTKTFLESPR